MNDKNFDLAEQEVRLHSLKKQQNKKNLSSKKGKLVAIVVLSLIFVSVGINSFLEIRSMNSPREQTKEEIVQDMNSYLFMVIAQLDAYTDKTGILPSYEEDFLGEDDPYVDYSVIGSGYQLVLSYADTTISFNSGEDPSQLLTEDVLEQMGIIVN